MINLKYIAKSIIKYESKFINIIGGKIYEGVSSWK